MITAFERVFCQILKITMMIKIGIFSKQSSDEAIF